MRYILILFCSIALAQSVPPHRPSAPSDPKQFEHLTAQRSSRLPPGWQAAAERFGKTLRLKKLTKRATPARTKFGQSPTGESRLIDNNWHDLWQSKTLSDGTVLWRISVQSPGSGGLRLHFDNFDIGSNSFWIYPDRSVHTPTSVLGPFTGRGPNDDGEFWSGTIFGDTAVIEFLDTTSRGNSPPTVNFDRVLHLYPFDISPPTNAPPEDTAPAKPRPAKSPAPPADEALAGNAPPLGAVINAASCEVDATCYPQYNQLAAGTLHYQFVADDGASYVCSGSLINTRASSLKPYIATAHHCISTDFEARSVEAFFGYAAKTCNAPSVFRDDAFRVTGARYMAGGGWGQGDYALLLLTSPAPPGSYFLGWNASDMPTGQRFVGLHHPRGSWRRIAQGSRSADAGARVEGETAPSDFFYQITYSLGLTEQGSSGSAIMTDSGQIYGTLSYGPAVPNGGSICSFPTQKSAYGRFSSAYPAYRPFLEDEAAPALSLSAFSLTFNVEGGTFTGNASPTVTVSTSSPSAVTFTATSSAAWLQVRTSSGQVSSTTPATLTITMDPSYFPTTGTQTATVRVASGTLVPLIINVTANIVVRDSRVIVSVNPNPVLQSDADTDGYSFFYTLAVAETGGIATTITSLTAGGVDYTSSIASWFGSTSLAANATAQVNLRARNITVPSQLTFLLSGIDPVSRRTWSQSVIVPFNAKPAVGKLTMTSQPAQIQQDPTSIDCPWLQYVVVSETAGYPVRLTKFVADGDDLSSEIADYFDLVNIPARGAAIAGICWTGIRAPDVLDFQVEGRDSGGRTVATTLSTRFIGPLVNPVRLTVPGSEIIFSALSSRTAPLTPVQLPVTFSRTGVSWTARIIFSQKETAWLSAGPLSGTGSSIISIAPSLIGVSAGTYYATLFIESTATLPQSILVPITLTIVAPRTQPALSNNSVAHNASYKGALTPGALASVFGTNLAVGSDIAYRVPLPNTLGVTSARVNGRIAPLLYAGTGQVNFQVPWETETGTATLVVDVAGQTAQTTFAVNSLNPGIYTSNGRALVPQNSATRSSVILAFVTGIGLVSPTIPTGSAPDLSYPITGLPQPRGAVTATIGGVPARVLFSAIPYGLVGILQANIEVAINSPIGDQPLVITVAGVPSPPAYLTIR